MRPLPTRAPILLATLFALWVACTTLHVQQVASGSLAWVGVYVTAPTDGEEFPTVRGFWPGASNDMPGALQLGDRLLSVGTASLRGVGPFGFVARTYAVAAERHHLRVPITYERDGVVGHTRTALIPVTYPWRMLPVSCALMITAALVLLRRPNTRIAHALFLLAVAYGLHWGFFFGGAAWQTYTWMVVFFGASLVMLPLILRAVLVFPAEVAPPNGRLPWWPWLFALFGPISMSWIFGVPLPPDTGFRLVFAVNVTFITTVLVVLTRNFRRAGPLGRRQLKWVVLGMYLGMLPVLLADAVATVAPTLIWLHEVAAIAEVLVPLSLLVAIVRANLFDIDRLITGAAAYTVLSVLVLAAVLAAVPPVAAAVSAAGDLDQRSVELLFSIAAAATIVPGYRWLSPRIERVLFHERHALRTGIEALLRELATAAGPEQLLTLVGERLDALLSPHSCLIYAPPIGDRFVPVVARGAEHPEGLPADAAAIKALRTRTAPIEIRRWAAAAALRNDERESLHRLRAATLLPVHRGDELVAAICLGSKRSGDVYTATDLALLAAVADKVSAQLRSFDADLILAQERAMSDALRRYVPRPVVARLNRGQSIDGGERDVSVLFVDIRGYTTYSEQQTVGTVFSMVNRYTEAVSAAIQRRGGTVVEFLGDGVMAVFGAPEPMPGHARAAVQAACEVVSVVRRLTLGASEVGVPIEVGVGVATGRAFVGNIQTNDRFVYTAVGDVVNLASRIERLTRELSAAVAIDAHTHRTAGDAAARFRRHERVSIRGRAEPVDVYSLPLAAA